MGNWMANASRTEDMIQEYEDIQAYVLSHAKDFDLAHFVTEGSEINGVSVPSQKLETDEDIEKMITEYDEEVFWEEMIERMTIKEIFGLMSEDEIEGMQEEEFIELYETVREKYEEEFDDNGLVNLEVTSDCDESCDEGNCCGDGCCKA